MKLYHGTSADLLDQIKANGLQPRAKSRHKGNWKHTIQSNRNAVYLTDAYPFHFAATSGPNKPGLILEIAEESLLPWLLCPDEDAIEQSTRRTQIKGGAPLDWSMEKRTKFYRKLAPFNPELASVSLQAMGTAGYYGTISFEAVTRYVIIDWKKMDPNLYLMAVDTMVSVLNYKILKERHRALVRWFFDDPVTASDLILSIPDDDSEMGKLQRERLAFMAMAMANRSALELVTVKKRPVKDLRTMRYEQEDR